MRIRIRPAKIWVRVPTYEAASHKGFTPKENAQEGNGVAALVLDLPDGIAQDTNSGGTPEIPKASEEPIAAFVNREGDLSNESGLRQNLSLVLSALFSIAALGAFSLVLWRVTLHRLWISNFSWSPERSSWLIAAASLLFLSYLCALLPRREREIGTSTRAIE